MSFYIISGSTLGTAEDCASAIAQQYNQTTESENLPVQVLHSPSLDKIADASRLVVVCATYGAGDYPDSFAPLAEAIAKSEKPFPALEKVLLVGVGSSDYDTFNHAIKNFAELLASKGITPVAEPLLVDIIETFYPDETVAEYFTANSAEFFA